MNERSRKLYWLGNSAKTQIIDEILSAHPDGNRDVTIFDYGCGDGGDWPTILKENHFINLIGYEPGHTCKTAAERLKGLKAKITGGDSLPDISIKADYVVSFSVFEHVVDKTWYLKNVKRLLAEDGLFYLNYDDGHFRNMLDLSDPATWMQAVRSRLRTLVSPFFAILGEQAKYQKRIIANDADRSVSEAGFMIDRIEYNNLESLKNLFKTIPDDQKEEFARMWLDLEQTLNRHFKFETSVGRINDDKSNLWQQMASRTLRLRHA